MKRVKGTLYPRFFITMYGAIDSTLHLEHYENDKILFDYKLKEGRCQTTNAKYLLHMAGIID